MKKHIYKYLFFASVIASLVSCNVEEFSDLNSPEVDAFSETITRGDLQDLIGGVLYSSRLRLGTYNDDCGVIGREFWRFSSSDPRFTGDLLGRENSVLDNNTFYITGPWAARYRTVKNANLIIGFLDGQDTSALFTGQEVNATKGFLKTFIALELLLNLNLTYEDGIRVDVTDENDLGPFVSKDAALAAISAMLADAANDLANGGPEFPYILSTGFDGFNTPESFRQASQAIAARVAMYQGDATSVLSHLGSSFMNLSSVASGLRTGIYYSFSAGATDILNPMFFPLNASTAGARIMQPSFTTDAEAGDSRLSKVVFRELEDENGDLQPNPLTLDGLTGDYDVYIYNSNIEGIPIIRNEELILLYAEANISLNPGQSVNAINIIRTSANLPAYTGGTDPTSLLNEVLNQRRYSLYAEGHRWIDMRRYGRLDELPIDRPEDDVWTQFPIPLTEGQ